MRRSVEEAFTLIEMMVGILIIGILAVIVVPNLFPLVGHAHDDHARTLALTTGMAFGDVPAVRHGKPASFADIKPLARTEDLHVGLVQDFTAAGLGKFCVLAYSDKGTDFTQAAPLVIYDGKEAAACPVDTSTAIWR